MPSASHEIIRAVFASHSTVVKDLLAALLRDKGRSVLSEGQDLQPYPAEAITLTTREHRADLVFLVRDPAGVTLRVIVLEIQLREDDEKPYTWPHYTTTFRLRHRCPCDLIVVTPYEHIATWASQAVQLDTQNTYQPVVLGPRWIPVITDPEQAMACMELAVFSVLAHGRTDAGPAVGRAVLLALYTSDHLDDDRRVLYYDVICKALPKAVLQELEELMSLQDIEYESDFAKHHYSEGREKGREEGRAEAMAKSLLRVLVSRGISVTEAHRSRIFSCNDQDTLERWFDRALKVTSADELFD